MSRPSRPPAADPALVRQIQAQAEVIRRRPGHDPHAMAPGPDGKPRVRYVDGR